MADADLAAVFAATDAEGLDHDAARLREHVLRDFRRGGVDLDPATRAEVTRLADRDTELSLTFGRNIRGTDDIIIAVIGVLTSPIPTPCAAASGCIVRETSPSPRTSSARPGR